MHFMLGTRMENSVGSSQPFDRLPPILVVTATMSFCHDQEPGVDGRRPHSTPQSDDFPTNMSEVSVKAYLDFNGFTLLILLLITLQSGLAGQSADYDEKISGREN